MKKKVIEPLQRPIPQSREIERDKDRKGRNIYRKGRERITRRTWGMGGSRPVAKTDLKPITRVHPRPSPRPNQLSFVYLEEEEEEEALKGVISAASPSHTLPDSHTRRTRDPATLEL